MTCRTANGRQAAASPSQLPRQPKPTPRHPHAAQLNAAVNRPVGRGPRPRSCQCPDPGTDRPIPRPSAPTKVHVHVGLAMPHQVQYLVPAGSSCHRAAVGIAAWCHCQPVMLLPAACCCRPARRMQREQWGRRVCMGERAGRPCASGWPRCMVIPWNAQHLLGSPHGTAKVQPRQHHARPNWWRQQVAAGGAASSKGMTRWRCCCCVNSAPLLMEILQRQRCSALEKRPGV